MSRLEELERAHERLKVLVNAAALVALDPTASEFTREAAATHGTVIISADDLHARAALALTLAKRRIAERTGVLP